MLEKLIVLSGTVCPATIGWIPSWMYQAVVSNGLLYGMKRGENTNCRAPKNSRKNDTPMAVISAAILGASRSGL